MEDLIAIIAIVCIFGLPVIAGIILGMRAIKSRNDERMGLINQGIIPPDTPKKRKQPPTGSCHSGTGLCLLLLE